MSLFPADGLFARLRDAAGAEWAAYTRHPFVRGIAEGTLPEPAFRHYLGQDYLFLIHFARAYALAAYKSERLADMRRASAAMANILDTEMSLHLQYCRGWGMDEAAVAALPEDPATMAYTRFVLECGMAGDLLDLNVALAPCVVGYGEVGAALLADPATRREGNPYLPWIETYGGGDYQEVARAAAAHLDDLARLRLGAVPGPGAARWDSLAATFRRATQLEGAFWQMGLDAG